MNFGKITLVAATMCRMGCSEARMEVQLWHLRDGDSVAMERSGQSRQLIEEVEAAGLCDGLVMGLKGKGGIKVWSNRFNAH